MTAQSRQQLRQNQCTACEGGIAQWSLEEVHSQLQCLPGWELYPSGTVIGKRWKKKDFAEALDFCRSIGELAEAEGHHPDLHLTGYRHVEVVLTTHAIGGLSLNDFILAAKIDELG
jgi:4a-hydroxytetrahydrobiopterin dehydratase